jgi:hypothetical protein
MAAAGILAQTPQTQQPPQTPQTPAQSSPSSSDKKITVTGCLKAAPSLPGDVTTTPGTTGTAGSATSSATATTGTADSAGAPEKFVLIGASASPGDTSATAQTYRLIANPTSLTAHVGKKLELTGTIDPTSTADPKDPSASAPALRVESGKIVAASCSE